MLTYDQDIVDDTKFIIDHDRPHSYDRQSWIISEGLRSKPSEIKFIINFSKSFGANGIIAKLATLPGVRDHVTACCWCPCCNAMWYELVPYNSLWVTVNPYWKASELMIAGLRSKGCRHYGDASNVMPMVNVLMKMSPAAFSSILDTRPDLLQRPVEKRHIRNYCFES